MHGKILTIVVLAAFGCAFCEEQAQPEAGVAPRYKSILDRMPFGPEPEGFDPTKPPSEQKLAAGAVGADGMTEEQRNAEAQKMLGAVKVSVINVTPDGRTAVGFTDSAANPPANYYLYVGQEKNGWKVVSANVNADGRDVTLSRDGVEATVKLGEGTGGAAGKGKGAPGANNAGPRGIPGSPAMRARVGQQMNGPQAPGGGASPLSRLRERRLARQQAAEADRAAQAKAAEERKIREAEEQERKAQEKEEREQQRQQLQAMAEELKKQREQREAEKAAEKEKTETEAGNGESE